MLGNNPFYYRTIRRNVIAFGTIFKDITMINYTANTDVEISRITVPLSYSGKENFLSRLLGNPDLHKPTQINLPRMTFEMVGIGYDPTRKLSSYISTYNKVGGTTVNQQYSGVPYNLDFELYIYVRNVEDGTQIVEQILPYFNPDYTLSMSFVDQMDIVRDIPIILESVDYAVTHEGPADTTVRTLIWTLKFKMKTYFFGPITSGGIITKATANSFIYNATPDNIISATLAAGFGDYKIGEIVYQGTNLPDSNVSATVVAWDNVSRTLTLTNRQGNFLETNANIIGTQTQASHALVYYTPNTKLVETVVVTPDPLTANIGDDFGFTTVISDYP